MSTTAAPGGRPVPDRAGTPATTAPAPRTPATTAPGDGQAPRAVGIRLVRTEWLRLFSRRFTTVMLMALTLGFLIVFFTTLANSHRPSAAEIERAQQIAAVAHAESRNGYAACVQANGAELCSRSDLANVRYEKFLDHVFVFSQSIRVLVVVLAVFLGLFGFLVGASFVGAELDSGGMANLLLWRPRRRTVLGAKLVALLGGVLAVSVAATVVFVGALWLLGLTMGLVGSATGGFWLSLVLLWLRALVLILAASSLGFALATLGGRTSAALGVVAGYLVVWELGGRVMLSLINMPGVEHVMLSSYLWAWGSGHPQYYRGACSSPVDCAPSFAVTPFAAAVVLGLLLTAIISAAFAAFRRRDLA